MLRPDPTKRPGSDQSAVNNVTDPKCWENKMLEALTRTNCPREQSIGKKRKTKSDTRTTKSALYHENKT